MHARRTILGRTGLIGALGGLLLVALPAPAWAPFANFRGNSVLEYQEERACRDGIGQLTLYDHAEDDPDLDPPPEFEVVTASPPPPDSADPSVDPYPADATILDIQDVVLEYVPGGVLADEDNDGADESDRRYYRKDFEIRFPRALDPGDVVEIDIDEGNTDPSTIQLTVLDCLLDPYFETILAVDERQVCRDGIGQLDVFDVGLDDADREVSFDVVTASPPPADADPDADPVPPADTVVDERTVMLDYVPGGVLVDPDGDGPKDSERRYYRRDLRIRFMRDGSPVALAPGSVVEVDLVEGSLTAPAPQLEVQDCRLDTTRLAGSDRWATAVAISRARYPGDGSASTVVIARGDEPNGFADALSGAPFAVENDGPILLTMPDRLMGAAADELIRVLPEGRTVHLLGGELALSPDVETAIQQLGYETVRLAGETRFETAIEIADALGDPSVLLITTGLDFADALAAGAAAATVDGAVLLTPPDERDPAVDEYLAAHPDAEVYAVGGPAARPYDEATALAGDDRFETAIAVAEAFFDAPEVVAVARSHRFPDSLAGGAHIASLGGPLLLSPTDALDDETAAYLCANASIAHAFLYGGTLALSDDVRTAVGTRVEGSAC